MMIDPRLREALSGPVAAALIGPAVAEALAAAPPLEALAKVRENRLAVAKLYGWHLCEHLPDSWSADRIAGLSLALADAVIDRLAAIAAEQADPTGAPN